MDTTAEARAAALARIGDLKAIVEQQPSSRTRDELAEECEALGRAVSAFHMEGIRFRSFNVDRLIHKGGLPLPPAASEAFADIRRHLEAAGFHTRSHQSPV